MDWTDEAAHQLEVVTGDPMADAVVGVVRIVEAPAPKGRGRYQECAVVLAAEAPGIEPRSVRASIVFDTRRWPAPGVVLPARLSRSHPDVLEVAWDALAG